MNIAKPLLIPGLHFERQRQNQTLPVKVNSEGLKQKMN